MTEGQEGLGADQRSELYVSFFLAPALMVRFHLFLSEILLFSPLSNLHFLCFLTSGSSAQFFKVAIKSDNGPNCDDRISRSTTCLDLLSGQ